MNPCRMKEAAAMVQMVAILAIVIAFCVGTVTSATFGLIVGTIVFFPLATLGGWAILKEIL